MTQAALIVQMANFIAAQEQEIEALKWYRTEYDRMGQDLNVAKAELNKYRSAVFQIPVDVKKQLADMIENEFPNQKIEQIKFFRGLTNCGLKEAKDWVEQNLYGQVPF